MIGVHVLIGRFIRAHEIRASVTFYDMKSRPFPQIWIAPHYLLCLVSNRIRSTKEKGGSITAITESIPDLIRPAPPLAMLESLERLLGVSRWFSNFIRDREGTYYLDWAVLFR